MHNDQDREQRRRTAVAALLMLLGVPGAAVADPCATSAWNLGKAAEAFRRDVAHRLPAPAVGQPSLVLPTDTLLEVPLAPASEVPLAHAPSRPPPPGKDRVAAIAFEVEASGRYVLSLDRGAWIDVGAGTDLLESADHRSTPGCPLFRKSVAFDLVGRRPYILQLTGSDATIIRLVVTSVAAAPQSQP